MLKRNAAGLANKVELRRLVQGDYAAAQADPAAINTATSPAGGRVGPSPLRPHRACHPLPHQAQAALLQLQEQQQQQQGPGVQDNEHVHGGEEGVVEVDDGPGHLRRRARVERLPNIAAKTEADDRKDKVAAEVIGSWSSWSSGLSAAKRGTEVCAKSEPTHPTVQFALPTIWYNNHETLHLYLYLSIMMIMTMMMMMMMMMFQFCTPRAAPVDYPTAWLISGISTYTHYFVGQFQFQFYINKMNMLLHVIISTHTHTHTLLCGSISISILHLVNEHDGACDHIHVHTILRVNFNSISIR